MVKNGKKQKNTLLARRVTNTAVAVSLLVAFIGLIVGTVSFFWTLLAENMTDTFYMLGTAIVVSKDFADTEALAEDVVTAYRRLSEEERASTGTDEYRRHFSHVCELEDYKQLTDYLKHYQSINSYENIYFVAYDKDTNAFVHVIDTGHYGDTTYETGDWEYISPQEVEKLQSISITVPCSIRRNDRGDWIAATGVRLRDSQKATYGFLMADYALKNMAFDIVMFLIRYIIAIVAASILFAFLLNRHFAKTLAKPINTISTAAKDYIKDKKAGISDSQHFSSLDINTGDEIEKLGSVMADMEKELSAYVESIKDMTAKEERARAELDMAAQIQKSALPDIFPAFPDKREFDIYASMEAAKVVGGDFYDFFPVDDDHLCFAIADVSDKGIPAALFMMSVQSVIRSSARTDKSPARVLTDTNEVVCENNKLRMFVTVWLGILEVSTGRLIYANAGHEPAAFYIKKNSFELVRGQKKPAIGIVPGMKYEEQEIALFPGDKVFLYTDGVTEASDAEGKFFGRDALLEALRNHEKDDPEAVVKGVSDAISSFTKDAEQFDDMTMLCLSYNGGNDGGMI